MAYVVLSSPLAVSSGSSSVAAGPLSAVNGDRYLDENARVVAAGDGVRRLDDSLLLTDGQAWEGTSPGIGQLWPVHEAAIQVSVQRERAFAGTLLLGED